MGLLKENQRAWRYRMRSPKPHKSVPPIMHVNEYFENENLGGVPPNPIPVVFVSWKVIQTPQRTIIDPIRLDKCLPGHRMSKTIAATKSVEHMMSGRYTFKKRELFNIRWIHPMLTSQDQSCRATGWKTDSSVILSRYFCFRLLTLLI